MDSGGGGIEAGYYFQETYAPTSNTVSTINSQFEEDYTNFSGGTSLFLSYAFWTDIKNSFYQTDCLWKNNSASFGAAVDLTSRLTVEHCSTNLTNLFNCIANFTFPKNDVDSANHQLTTSGVMFIVNDSLLPLRVIPGKSFDIFNSNGWWM